MKFEEPERHQKIPVAVGALDPKGRDGAGPAALASQKRRRRGFIVAFGCFRSAGHCVRRRDVYPAIPIESLGVGMLERAAPGNIRDSILDYFAGAESATVAEIYDAVVRRLGDVPPSSVRSYLNLNVPEIFERTERGRYRLRSRSSGVAPPAQSHQSVTIGRAILHHADCFAWLRAQQARSIQAVITDPPYGLSEYSVKEQEKLRRRKGGVWRLPPAFDGHQRAPLPRFTVLGEQERGELRVFFREFGVLLARVTVPGANIVIASHPLLAHIVACAIAEAGLELRGTLIRLVMTMRGGDRPKNAHEEFPGVSVMPRSMWEPWIVARKPLEGRVQDHLRTWRTGGFRRPSAGKPFGDVIKSAPTSQRERRIAPHPSLKPQAFLRRLVHGALPLGEGLILDPFAGSGSTLAAADSLGLLSIGVESDAGYFDLAKGAIAKLASLTVDFVDPA